MTIITKDELKLKLGRPTEGEDAQQEKINLSVANVDKIIEQVTGTFFSEVSIEDEYIDGYGLSDNSFYLGPNNYKIWCPAPIISITSLYNDDTLLVENTDYYLSKKVGKIETDSIFSVSRRGIKLTGTFGYAEVPADIKEIGLLIGQAISGLAITNYLDEDGDINAVIKTSVPSWAWKHLKSRRRHVV